VNAYLGETGNERDFADRMVAVLRDPERADQIGAAGQKAAIAHLDYRGHITRLAQFFTRCSDYHWNRHSTPRIPLKSSAAV
jgi:glycosyltransferase involved in cell wall biosynthesis